MENTHTEPTGRGTALIMKTAKGYYTQLGPLYVQMVEADAIALIDKTDTYHFDKPQPARVDGETVTGTWFVFL